MGLELLVTFNKDDATAVKDFSGNARHAETVTGLIVGSGETIGKAGGFDGSTSEVDFGDILDLGGSADEITVMCRMKYDANAGTKYLCDKDNHFRLSLVSGAGLPTARFEVYIGAAWKTVTGATGLVAGTWYTITGKYDGTDLKVFVDDSEDGTAAQTGNVDASSSDFFVGSSGAADFVDAHIETLAVFSVALSADSIEALDSIPNGIKYEWNAHHKLETGDLVVDNVINTNVQAIVIWEESDVIAHLWPVSDNKFTFSDAPLRVGHIWDTDRQNISYWDNNGHNPEIKWLDGIAQFGDLTDASMEVVVIDKDGIKKGVTWEDANNILAGQVFG